MQLMDMVLILSIYGLEIKMDIAKMTAVELGRKIKTKEISVREAVEAVFDRIKSVEGEYNCYVTLCEEQALKKAEEIQKKIDDGTLTGPLGRCILLQSRTICVRRACLQHVPPRFYIISSLHSHRRQF